MDERVGRLERKVDVLAERLDTVDDWVSESKVFHREMSTFKDTFLGTQAAIREEQRLRHATNTTKLNWLMFLVAVGTLIITGIGIIVSVQVAKHQALNTLVSHEPIVTAEFTAQE